MIKMKNEFLNQCVVCERVQVDDSGKFWLDRMENPKAYASIMEDYKRKLLHGLCPEDIEKYRKIYGR
jgi:hypothetical protein